MVLDKKDKKNVNKMLIVSIFILAMMSVLSNQLDKLRLILYGICILTGVFSTRYTFVIIILTYTSFLSMFNGVETSGAISDFGLIAGSVCFLRETVIYIIEKQYSISKKVMKNGMYIFFIILLLASSIIVANIRFGQPIIRGIYSLRSLLLVLYMYPFIRLLKKNQKEKIVIMEYLTRIIMVSIITIIIQYILMDRIEILKLMKVTRLGEERILLHSASAVYCIVFAYNIYTLLKNKIVSIYRTLALILIGIAIFIVSQTRIFMAAILVITFLEILVFKNIKTIYKGFLCVIGFAILIILLCTNFVNQLLGNLFEDVLRDKDSYVRYEARDYYMSLIDDEFFLLGGGITNEKYNMSPINKAGEYGYFIVDIGIFGTFFEYGIIGIFVVILLTLTIFTKSLKMEDKQMANLLQIFCAFIVTTSYTVSPLGQSVWILYILMYSIMKVEENTSRRDSNDI